MKNQMDDYYVFCQVAKYGSMKKASEQVKLPLSTVSRRVVGLEQGLGIQLFVRSKNKLTLTNEGNKYYLALNDHLEAFAHALDELHESSGKLHGNIVISTTKMFYLRYIYPHIKELLQQNPGLSIELKNARSAADLSDDVDIAITSGVLPETNLIARKLMDVPLIFVASKGFSTTYKEHIENGHFNQIPYISTITHPSLTVKKNDSGEVIRLKPNSRLVVMDIELLIIGAVDSLGYGIVPAYIHEDIEATNDLIEIFEDHSLEPVRFSLLYRNRNLQTAAQRAVVERIMHGFQI